MMLELVPLINNSEQWMQIVEEMIKRAQGNFQNWAERAEEARNEIEFCLTISPYDELKKYNTSSRNIKRLEWKAWKKNNFK